MKCQLIDSYSYQNRTMETQEWTPKRLTALSTRAIPAGGKLIFYGGAISSPTVESVENCSVLSVAEIVARTREFYSEPLLVGEWHPLPAFAQVQEKTYNVTALDILKIYFRAYSDLLESVHLTDASSSDLEFSIVLKDDTSENRATVFTILDDPTLIAHDSWQPVFFQFYPQRLKDQIIGTPIAF